MIRCAITDLAGYGNDGGDPSGEAQRRLLEQAERWIVDGIELIQLREKVLGGASLLNLASHMVELARNTATRIVINSRVDVALASGADGVHLSADAGALSPIEVRRVFASAGRRAPLVSASCHSVEEVECAVTRGADLLLFGPVFEKRVGSLLVSQGLGFSALREAVVVAGTTPALALGGITAENTKGCLGMGAAGIAAIRLFA